MPFSLVPFSVMIGAERLASVIAVATVARIGEEDIALLIVANPLPSTFRPDKVALLATQAASGSVICS